MTCETAVVFCDSQTGQQIGTLSANSIADMEDAPDIGNEKIKKAFFPGWY